MKESQNIQMLPVHPGKTFEQLRRMDLTPEERKAYDKAREAAAFFKFAVKATQGKFKKSGPSILVDIAARDLKQTAKAGMDRDAPWFQGLSIIGKAEAIGDVGFFISLGRALSRNNDQAWGWDKLGWAMLNLMFQKRGISDKDAVDELKKQNLEHATAENFNKFYNRVRASLSPELQHLVPKRKRKPRRKS